MSQAIDPVTSRPFSNAWLRGCWHDELPHTGHLGLTGVGHKTGQGHELREVSWKRSGWRFAPRCGGGGDLGWPLQSS